MNAAFSFQVTSKGVIVTLNPELEFKLLKNALIKHVNEANSFFAGVDIYLNTNGRTMRYQDLKELMEIISEYKDAGEIFFLSEREKRDDIIKQSRDSVLIKRTVRSGQKIKYPTNIFIIGDVNPGAEVIAGGDVVVLGSLRGVVHAGATGSQDAEVIALKLNPVQLRIANIITRPPDESSSKNLARLERAYIKNSRIIVEEINI